MMAMRKGGAPVLEERVVPLRIDTDSRREIRERIDRYKFTGLDPSVLAAINECREWIRIAGVCRQLAQEALERLVEKLPSEARPGAAP